MLVARQTTIRLRQLLLTTAYTFYVVGIATFLYAQPLYWKQDYHTSALTGEAWVKELILGHPDRIYTELGVRLHVFTAFVAELRICGMSDSRNGITLEEQAAIFLYMCITGL
jgi:hypothetical protein